jgi:hypothetical protein
MASGSSAGVELLSSVINVSIASMFRSEGKSAIREKCYQQTGPSQLNFYTAVFAPAHRGKNGPVLAPGLVEANYQG